MNQTKRRRLTAVFLVAALVFTGTAASCGGSPGEVERCERDDHPSEPECRRLRKPYPKPAPKPPANQPAPRGTKR